VRVLYLYKEIGRESKWKRVHGDWKLGRDTWILLIMISNMQYIEIQLFAVSISCLRPETLQEHRENRNYPKWGPITMECLLFQPEAIP